jgi:hypothetical protein
MKRLFLVFLVFVIHVSVFAQWEVKVTDDGFEKSVSSMVKAKDGNAYLGLYFSDPNVGLTLLTDEISFKTYFTKVKVFMKVGDKVKEYATTGCSIKNHIMILSPEDVDLDNMLSLMRGQFLYDFKMATALKLKIEYQRYDDGEYVTDWKEFIFDMTGSTNAYNRVKTQK